MADYPDMVFENFDMPTVLGFQVCRFVGATKYWINKVYDPGGSWVIWETEDAADPAGALYPDPYGSGFSACTGYRTAGFKRYR